MIFRLIILMFLFLGVKDTESKGATKGKRDQQDDIEYLKNLITSAENNVDSYKAPKNAREFKPADKNIYDGGEYDFIIVGSGSAGSVMASRLSENPDWKILLIESGNFGDNLTDIPNMGAISWFTDYNWGFTSVPQTTACLGMTDKRCQLPRGKGHGGSSLINVMAYTRCSSLDYDRWAHVVQDSRWSYKSVLPYFKKSEHYVHRDKQAPVDWSVHGTDGLLNVEYHLPRGPQLDAFLKANEEIGVPIADYNSGTGLGASPLQSNTKKGKREDAGKAFLKPFLSRKNLDIRSQSYATKIVINDKTKVAEGVVFSSRLTGKQYEARATKEVILSAGAFQTPQLLMLSGVGPRRHLESFNISVVKDLEVGSKLKDHPTFYGMTFETNYTLPDTPIEEQIKEYLNGVGYLTATLNGVGVGFYESSFTKGSGLPDIEIIAVQSQAVSSTFQKACGFSDATYNDTWNKLNQNQSFSMFVIGLHSESNGTVRLKSSDPYDFPVIDPRFLSDPSNKDIDTLYEGIQLSLALTETKAFQKLKPKLFAGPLRACAEHEYLSKDYWYCALRQMSFNLFHPISTCPMGPNPADGDVVDSVCKVHGVKHLRVVDGSVLPFTLSGHPNAPIYMVAEVMADVIKETYGRGC